jgi:hypothetical protein
MKEHLRNLKEALASCVRVIRNRSHFRAIGIPRGDGKDTVQQERTKIAALVLHALAEETFVHQLAPGLFPFKVQCDEVFL